MKAIYYNIFGLGHINPTLPIVRELRQRGIQVIYHTSPERCALVTRAGAEFRNYGRDDYQAADYNPGKNFVLQTIPAAVGLLPFLLEEIEREQPDFLLYDSMAPWGKLLGHITKLPTFCTVTTFALNAHLRQQTFAAHGVQLDGCNLEAMEKIRQQYQLEFPLLNTLGAYNECNFVFTAQAFNPPLTGMNQAHFHFVGPLLNPLPAVGDDFPWKRLVGRKVITMALGTLLPTEDPSVLEWYRAVLDGLASDDRFMVVLGVGTRAILQGLGKIPRNAVVRLQIPQQQLLPLTDVFISHGGMNSVNESLAAGVPMLVIPHSKDQFVNANRVVELGVGQQLTRAELTPEKIKEGILHLLFSPLIRKRTEVLQQSFGETLGTKGLIELLLQKVLTPQSSEAHA